MKFKTLDHQLIIYFFIMFFPTDISSSESYMHRDHHGPFFQSLLFHNKSSSLFIGQIIDVIHTPCDTIIDTVEIDYNINLDTMNCNDEERKRRMLKFRIKNLAIKKLRMSGVLIKGDSAVIRKRVNCKPHIYVIKPESFCSPPAKSDTICLKGYYTTSQNMSYYKDKFIVAGHVLKSLEDSVNVYLVEGSGAYLMRIDVNLNYDCETKIDYKSALKSSHSKTDWNFELLKDLSKLIQEPIPKKRIKILGNLMYHQYFLYSPKYFEIITLTNLPDTYEKKKSDLIKKQIEISEKWKLSHN